MTTTPAPETNTTAKRIVSGSTWRFLYDVASTVERLQGAHRKIAHDVERATTALAQGKSRVGGFGGGAISPQYVMEAERYAAVLSSLTDQAVYMLRDDFDHDEIDDVWTILIARSAETGPSYIHRAFDVAEDES